MKKVLMFIAIIIAVAPCMAQNCYFPTVKGAKLTYRHYDGRGRQMKSQGKKPMWTTFTVEEVWPGENGDITINVLIENQHTAGIDLTVHDGAYLDAMTYGDVKIEGDSVVLDNMQGLLLKIVGGVPRKSAEIESYDITMDATMTFPRELYVGLELPERMVLNFESRTILTPAVIEMLYNIDGTNVGMRNVDGSIYDPGTPMIDRYSAAIKNWRVAGEDTVETPASAFECYKITYILMINDRQEIACTEWISPRVGLVKKVEYARKNRVAETMILESYSE